MKKTVGHRIVRIFKKWIVKRPNGQCQILFPLYELDNLVEKILSEVFLDHN